MVGRSVEGGLRAHRMAGAVPLRALRHRTVGGVHALRSPLLLRGYPSAAAGSRGRPAVRRCYAAAKHTPVPGATITVEKSSIAAADVSVAQPGANVPQPLDREEPAARVDDMPLSELLRTMDPLSRRQLSVLAVGTAVVSLGFGTVVPVLPEFAARFGDMGATGIGMMIAAPALAKLALNRAAGRRADSHGRVPLMASGAAISAAGNFLTAAAGSMAGVCGARLVVGAGSAAGGAASQAYVADVTAKFPRHRGAIMGTLGSIGMLSYGLGPAAGGLLAEQFGPAICFGTVGLASAICGAAYCTLPETLPKAAAAADAGLAAGAVGEARVEKTYAELLRGNHRLQALVVMDSAVYIGWAVWLAVIPLHCTLEFGTTPGQLGLMFSAMAIAGALGAPLGGVLSDRFGRNPTIACGAIGCGASTFLLPWSTSFAGFCGVLVAWEFAEGVIGAALSAFAAEVATERERGQVFALRSQAESAVFLVAPVTLGLIADTCSFGTSMWLSSAVMAAGVVTFTRLSGRATKLR
jgi:MFS family permease